LTARRTSKRKQNPLSDPGAPLLQDFRIRQPMPLMLSLLREADAGNLKPKQLARAFSLIERFHFGFTVIAKKSSSGGWSFLYGGSLASS
jgi:hypothetical protein